MRSGGEKLATPPSNPSGSGNAIQSGCNFATRWIIGAYPHCIGEKQRNWRFVVICPALKYQMLCRRPLKPHHIVSKPFLLDLDTRNEFFHPAHPARSAWRPSTGQYAYTLNFKHVFETNHPYSGVRRRKNSFVRQAHKQKNDVRRFRRPFFRRTSCNDASCWLNVNIFVFRRYAALFGLCFRHFFPCRGLWRIYLPFNPAYQPISCPASRTSPSWQASE